MLIQPYVFFDGRAEEALAFYGKAVGAQVLMLMRFKDNPDQSQPGCEPDAPSGEKVMHASVRIGESVFMVSDGECRGETDFRGFSLSITAANDSEATRCFDALVDGGQVVMPLAKTFFASSFGMLKDRFGVHWMVMAPA
ncbi:VOC family protein [Dyella sp. 20L07]|uniref:VOC family protein n=1 Tax=Dyella sp. 20L07 TaxID=3384240 RepID=UPI003D279253